jgi:hypothetical protein
MGGGLIKRCGWLRGGRYHIPFPKHFLSCSGSRCVHYRRGSHRDSRSFGVLNSAFGSDRSRWRESVNVPRKHDFWSAWRQVQSYGDHRLSFRIIMMFRRRGAVATNQLDLLKHEGQ